MRPNVRTVPALLCVALLWTAAAGILTLTPGCRKVAPGGVYAGDSFLFNSEQAVVTAKESLDVVVRWEYNNRKLLSGTPGITKAVDSIRARAPESFATAKNLIAAYKAAPTSENRQALGNAIAVVNQLVEEALGYYIKYGLHQ